MKFVNPLDHERFNIFRSEDGSILGPFNPPNYGFPDSTNHADCFEIASLLTSVLEAKSRYRMLSLGASPGEWAIRAERAFAKVRPGGDFMTVNVEADPEHIRIMGDYFRINNVNLSQNIMVYAAVDREDGWSYLPVVHSNNWGAGVARTSSDGGESGANISLPENQRMGALSGLNTDFVQYRGVMAMSLKALLDRIGLTDFLHCDIQGLEGVVFKSQEGVISRFVRVCCISIHSSEIEKSLLKYFKSLGWYLIGNISGVYIQGPNGEECHKDGVIVVRNPGLA